MRTSGSLAIGLMAVALAGLVLTSRAGACGNSVAAERASRAWLARELVQDEDQFMAHLLRAEEQLRLNQLAGASDELDVLERRIQYASLRMRSRFWRTASLLTVRSEGIWPQVVMRRVNSERQRANALERAVARLRLRALEAPNDPVRRTDLAEALASVPRPWHAARAARAAGGGDPTRRELDSAGATAVSG